MLVKDIKEISGIYKIDFPNGKSYIGLSNNMKVRFKDHNIAAKTSELPLYKAVRKYLNGKITEATILEEIDANNREKLCEREKYWIDYYGTFKDKTKGYNLTPGGDGASAGIYNNSAKFSQEEIEQIYRELQEDVDTFIYQLAAKHNISCEGMSEINCGKRYYNPQLSYPLRKAPTPLKRIGLENHLTKFTQETLNEIYDLLQNTTLTFNDIAARFGVCYGTISNINNGKRYAQDGYIYPLRQGKQKNLKLSEEQVNEIKRLLKDTSVTQNKIAEQFKVSVDTIYRINDGKNYKTDNFIYPIRAKVSKEQ